MIFLKEKSQTTKSYEKLPSMLRVKCIIAFVYLILVPMSFLFCFAGNQQQINVKSSTPVVVQGQQDAIKVTTDAL